MLIHELYEQTTGSRQFLYHWTNLISLTGIIRSKAIGYGTDYDPMQGYKALEKRFVSFTRDKNYSISGKGKDGGIRITYDWDILRKKGIKTKPVRGLVGKSGGDWHDVLTGREARFEAEEYVMGPIPFTKEYGLVAVEATSPVISYIKKIIANQKEYETELNQRAAEAEKRSPTVKDYRDYKGLNWRQSDEEKLVDDGYFDNKNWKPRWWNSTILRNSATHHKKLADEYTNLLSMLTLIPG